MDVFCDYCGAKLDVEHENCCTQCGAPFDNNESVKAYREEKRKKEEEYRRMKEMRQKEYDASQQQAQNVNTTVRNNSSQKVVKIIVTVFIILFFAPTILSIIITLVGEIFSAIEDNIDYNYGYIEESSAEEVSSLVQEVQRVNFNETAQTAEYSFLCDEVYRTDIPYGSADKGYMYVAFHFKVKNTTDNKLWLTNDLNCVYDGDIGCDRAWSFDEGKSFNASAVLSAGIGTDGYMCYIVPEKAKSVVISYGDYVRVNIDLRNLEYKTESDNSDSETSSDNN